MYPAYLAAALLSLVALRPQAGQSLLRNIEVAFALLLAGASILLSIALPMFRLPKPTGPYPVGTTVLYFNDLTRGEDASSTPGATRELMVQLWYPAQNSTNRQARYREWKETRIVSSYQSGVLTNSRVDAPIAAAGAPFPVILFNHGWGGRRTNDTFLAEDLASHGYLVASIDHTYNAEVVAFPDGRIVKGSASKEVYFPETSTPEEVRIVWDKELLKWEADQRFILDRLEVMNDTSGSSWYGRIDTHMAGAIGHSFGGAASTQICAEDPRVHASVNMDGWFFAAIRLRGPNQPLLAIQTDQPNISETNTVGGSLDATDFADLTASVKKFGGFVMTVSGATHDDFTDEPLVSPFRMISHRGTLPTRRVHDIVRSYVLAFFDKTLRGEDSEILHTKVSPYTEVSLKEWPSASTKSNSDFLSMSH
jgi:predicted dienelactone hydrolase